MSRLAVHLLDHCSGRCLHRGFDANGHRIEPRRRGRVRRRIDQPPRQFGDERERARELLGNTGRVTLEQSLDRTDMLRPDLVDLTQRVLLQALEARLCAFEIASEAFDQLAPFGGAGA